MRSPATDGCTTFELRCCFSTLSHRPTHPWQGYGELISGIIRPPRAEYDIRELGPLEFGLGGKQFARSDLVLTNTRGLTIQCSHWAPAADSRPAAELPCVVYMHGNAGCRVAALEILKPMLAVGVTVFTFDFAGSGLSEGDWVSLGYYERDDLAAVVTHLRGSGSVSTIGLWGRSMGAATALVHGHRDPSIAGMVSE
jgi:pimeloyl-ACP methyl ester carboxylesterase